MQNQYRIKHTTQRGMTLIELIAALGVAAVVIVGALSLYKNADDSQKANELLSSTTSVRGSIRQIFGGQYGAAGTALLPTIGNAGKLPPSWRPNNPPPNVNAVTNEYGPVTIASGPAVGAIPAGGTMVLTLNNIPTSVCTTIASGMQGWLSVAINGAAINYPLNSNIPAQSPAAVAAACAAAANVTMVFTGT